MRAKAVTMMTALLAAAPVAADDGTGVFIGVSGGRADVNETLASLDLSGIGVDVQVDDDSPAWSAFGGYQLNRYFGVRGGYQDFQTFDDLLEVASIGDVPDIDVDLEGWMIGLDAYLPLGEWVSLAGHAGYIDWESKVEIGDLDVRSSESGTDPFIGGGVEVNLGAHFGVEASYTRFDVDGSDVDYAALGVRFRF